VYDVHERLVWFSSVVIWIIKAADILIYHKEPCNNINCMGLPYKVYVDIIFTI